MIEAKNLVVGYARRNVVRVEALTIRQGEITALIGANAAGKSTLIRSLAGMLKPREGTVHLLGRDVYRTRARDLARDLAFVGQDNSEAFAFTVHELVQIGAAANPSSPRPAAERIEKALKLLDLTDLAERDLMRLSGGERQRAAAARALAQDTRCLLLDEPTAHLDLRHQAALMEACRTMAANHGTAVLVVLHDLNLASAYSDRIILLSDGQIVADGAPEQVITNERIAAAYQTPVSLSWDEAQNRPYVHIAPRG